MKAIKILTMAAFMLCATLVTINGYIYIVAPSVIAAIAVVANTIACAIFYRSYHGLK